MENHINTATTVNVYEDNAGVIHAIVTEGENVVNIISGLGRDNLTIAEFIAAAQEGFVYTDDFDPDDYCGFGIDEVAEEIRTLDDLIATITADRVELYTESMGIAGRILFGITEY